ncbi:MAG TPA: carboxypeptidase-like regulatory domain-containing protein [Gemmatimonadaceae bacterium]|nr:carboxypeptidase-like regulatory domain-containing protein [Gemmatimonadaceae bacterium]
MRLFRAILLTSLAVPCIASGIAAQSVFLGTVTADGEPSPPLPNTEITLPDLNLGIRTDSLGHFALNGIPRGTYRVNIRRVGYNAISIHAQFSGKDTLDADIALTPLAVTLDTVNVKAEDNGHLKFLEFEERRAHGQGSYLTRADIAKDTDRQLGEIVARIPGVKLNRYGAESSVASARYTSARGGDAMDRRKGAPRACYAQVYVDDVRVFGSDPGESLFNINTIQPSSIQAIEYYRSRAETPIKYASYRADCGTLLIWTRIE